MFGRKKKKTPEIPYASGKQRAVLRCSICTGEQVAGFKEMDSGKFTEVMLIKNEKDLEDFLEMYHLTTVTKEY